MFLKRKMLNRSKPSSMFGFAFFMFGLTLLTQLFHGYNFYYYLDQGLVDITWATICKIAFVIVDWLNDLLFGYLSEKTKSKLGKRVPWLIYGALLLPLFIILTYVINKGANFSIVGFGLYYLIISIGMENASTIMYTNYNALLPNLFTTSNKRREVSSVKKGLEILGMITCYLLTPVLVSNLNLPYYVVAIIYTFVYLISLYVSLRTIKVKDDINAQTIENGKYSFKQTIKDVSKEKPFILYNIAQSFFAAILSIIVSLYPMYCKYLLHIEGFQQSLCFGIFFATLICSLPLWYFLIKKYGHTKTWLINYLISPFALILFLIPNNFITGLITCGIIGIFFGALMICPDMISSELIDIDKLKYKVSREAALGSIANLIGRISVILSAIATAIIAIIFGYKSGSEPGDNPYLTFKILFGVMLPIIAALGAIFAFIYYKFSKKDRLTLLTLKKETSNKTSEVSITEIIKNEKRENINK